MRSALICVFFSLAIQMDGSRAENDEIFKPTPIPLSYWLNNTKDIAGPLQEFKTEAPSTVAAIPAHYWEDALRHSVYLTLVRDKIDELIAKGAVISPDSKPHNHLKVDVDDHDLWEKIKTARFDRLLEEPIPPGDVTILARGRLLQDKDGFRFTEDGASGSNCSDSDCTKGIKALWSVKRVRQGEMSSGKYHYELTFAVTSQTSRKSKKPYENPARTFTIKENSPFEHPHTRNKEQDHHVGRPQRAIWVHKNINPPNPKDPSYSRGLDRIFSSLFSDEDSYEEPSNRHKQKSYIPPTYLQHAKVGHVDDRNRYNQKKIISYPMPKPQSFRYTHSSLPVPPPPESYVQHPYLNVVPIGNNPYIPPHSDNKYLPTNVVKTTRPAVLPTPIPNFPILKESTIEVPVKTKLNATEYTTKEPDVVIPYKIHNQPKQPPMKVSYFPDHIRPPVYNAPPGVFVTMDKKPFKPMPPAKFSHSNKPHKNILPDFRPSPQVLESQFSDPDSTADTAFRPITMNYREVPDSIQDNSKKGNKYNQKQASTFKKPQKKHENVKSHRPTTLAPEIITAHSKSSEDDSSMEWANLLGAFTKTTPMASHKDRSTTENIESSTATLTPTTTEDSLDDIEVSSQAPSTTISTTTTTTPKTRKRTRPPPKFPKQEKIKKHKRVTSTTTTTVKPMRMFPTEKSSFDLMPQASSAATSGDNSIWETKPPEVPKTSTTTSTTSRPTTTTKMATTSSITSTSSKAVGIEPIVTPQPKSRNRFRQSTLMQKGTSVNHDKWSAPTPEKSRTISVISSNFPRRKASKFQGYIPHSTPRSPEAERSRNDHEDHAYNSDVKNISSTTENRVTTATVQEINYGNQKQIESDLVNEPDEDIEDEQNEAVQDSRDDTEYIFSTASPKSTDTLSTTEITVVASPHSIAPNKTKCKKKKHNNLTTTEGVVILSSETETATSSATTFSSTSTTQSAVTEPDIFAELFGGFTMDDITEKPKTENPTQPPEPFQSESGKHEHYVHIDDDLEDFLASLDHKSNHHTEEDDKADKDDKLDEDNAEEEYDDDSDDEDSPFNNDEENFNSKHTNDEYYEDSQASHRRYSLLELMAIE